MYFSYYYNKSVETFKGNFSIPASKPFKNKTYKFSSQDLDNWRNRYVIFSLTNCSEQVRIISIKHSQAFILSWDTSNNDIIEGNKKPWIYSYPNNLKSSTKKSKAYIYFLGSIEVSSYRMVWRHLLFLVSWLLLKNILVNILSASTH